MVVNDYGKRAYHLACELEKRIEKIEKNSIESVYNEIIFNFTDVQNLSSYKKSFSINALRESRYIIQGSIKVKSSAEKNAKINIYVDKVLAFSFEIKPNVETPFLFEATLTKGVNLIITELSSSDNFTIDSLNFKVCGTVNYVESNNLLTHATYESKDYIGHLLNDNLTIYKYDTQNGLEKLKGINNLLEANFLGIVDSIIYIIGIDDKRNLVYIEFSILYNTVFRRLIGVNNVSSVCGYLVNRTMVLYYSKLNEIYKGVFLLGNEFTYEKTGRKGIKLYSDSNSPDKYVVVDKLLNTKLIVN